MTPASSESQPEDLIRLLASSLLSADSLLSTQTWWLAAPLISLEPLLLGLADAELAARAGDPMAPHNTISSCMVNRAGGF